jgi:hypothetical protein
MQVNRRGRDRGMAQVVANGREFGTTVERMGRVGMAHPVGRCPAQLVRQARVVGVHQLCGLFEKPAHQAAQPGVRDPRCQTCCRVQFFNG